jgi:acyl carrier protein
MNSQEVSAFCVDQLAEILRIPKDTIDVNAKFTRLGLDSAMTVYLLMELEDRLDLELSAETFLDHPTVADLSAHLADKIAARAAQPAAAR